MWNVPSGGVASISDSLLQLLLGGLGGIWGDALRELVVEIFAAGVRHVGCLEDLIWIGLKVELMFDLRCGRVVS